MSIVPMNYKTSFRSIVVASLFVYGVTAAAQAQETSQSAFQMVMRIAPAPIVVPTVVEVPLIQTPDMNIGFAVEDVATKKLLPSYVKESYTKVPVSVFATTINEGDVGALVDGEQSTSVEYPLTNPGTNEVTITLSGADVITASGVDLKLARNVTMPRLVRLTAKTEDGQEKVLVATRPMTGTRINFPKTLAREFIVTFFFEQPLTITELALVQEDVPTVTKRSLRFLAQPKSSYRLYLNPDRSVTLQTSEGGNLRNDVGVLLWGTNVDAEVNPLYIQADIDNDGVVDVADNCVSQSNPLQEDIDKNGVGDICEDFDRDGVVNSTDNCPNTPNVGQRDEDGDGIGDTCDEKESRLTERYTWVPWAGMGIALSVLIGLFALVGLKPTNIEGVN